MKKLIHIVLSFFLIEGTALKAKPDNLEGKEVITIGIEDTPGLLQRNGKGIIDLVLNTIEKETNFEFKKTYLSYARAKIEFAKGRFDMIGLISHHFEVKDFYRYAEDLDWNFKTNLVLFCNAEESLKLKKHEIIGTPAGNENFISKLIGAPSSQFHRGNLKSIILGVAKRRWPCFVFEEISSLNISEKLKVKSLYYRIVGEVRGSFAVARNGKKKNLKKILDEKLLKINWNKYLKDIRRLPEQKNMGIVYP